MNEEQTVLDFFAREENFPLALIAAEHLDGLRLQYNNRFWNALHEQLDTLLTQQNMPWQPEITEDRNTAGMLVGLHLQARAEQRTLLLPFMEQQLMGDSYRIYYGLMWSVAPEPAQKNLPAVEALRAHLSESGFKTSDSFLAWQWSPWYPRRKDFLLRFASQKDDLLQEAMQPWQALLLKHGELLHQANLALNDAPRSATVSLDQLRSKIKP